MRRAGQNPTDIEEEKDFSFLSLFVLFIYKSTDWVLQIWSDISVLDKRMQIAYLQFVLDPRSLV
jgi:hypothetical protein